mmetsp:Transcript_47118/g.98799  ORF Transcript_47118/g.98799 Transcript_47118/m.98799 type:complete len:628 (+) Transcript_47118:159-2042(+)
MAGNNKNRSSIHLVFMSIIAFGVGFLMSYDAATMQQTASLDHRGMGEKILRDDSSTTTASDPGGTAAATDTLDTPSTTLELLGIITMKQRQLFNTVIRAEYGKHDNIFNADSIERLFQISPLSKKRLKRKLMMKIVEGRIQRGKGGGSKSDEQEQPTFHWVTAGDSAAAGMGNRYSHSYTAVLEDTVGDLFQSAGIHFTASNHAGDAWSGMELALCMDTIFGTEVDVLSWDFMKMTNDAHTARDRDPLSSSQGVDPVVLGERAGRIYPHLPFLFYLGLFSDGGAWDDVHKLETSGMGVNILGGEALRELILTFPNYNLESGRDASNAVKQFRCDGIIEGKEMCNEKSAHYRCDSKRGFQCAHAKYHGECKYERYQTPWNDGWKMHRLKGRLLGFHLINMLHLAAVELDVLERQRNLQPKDVLNLLKAEEEVEEFLFAKTRPTSLNIKGNTMFQSWDILKQKSTVCLNAKAALLQYATSMNKPGTDNLPQVEFDPPKDTLCDAILPFQHSFFRVSKGKDWATIDAYEEWNQIIEVKDSVAFGICFRHCYGNQCGDDRTPDRLGIDWDKVEIRVNGDLVSGVRQVGGCHILQGEEGVLWNKPVRSLSSGLEIKYHGDDALLLSSVFILH